MWLVIGYGNLLRQDDGVGYRVAEQLLARQGLHPAPPAARILALHQLTAELTLELAAADVDRVLFIDARRGQQKPLLMNKLNPAMAQGSCGHHLTPELLLHMTAALYRRSPPGWLLSVAAVQMGVGDTLSERAQATVAAVLRTEQLLAKASKVVAK